MKKQLDVHALLTLEGYLFHGALTHGLTALRSADVSRKGSFYTAFFQLSIGLERLMKVVVLIDHMARNSLALPSNKTLKDLGHDLVELFDHLHGLPNPAPNPLTTIKRDSVAFAILTFLSEFAKRTRYYSLDSLVDAPTTTDPLAAWQKIIEAILVKDVKDWQKHRMVNQTMAVAVPLQKAVIVTMRNLDGSAMDVADYTIVGQIHELTARYAIWHLLTLLKAMRELVEDSVDRTYETAGKLNQTTTAPVPYMIEFLDFTLADRKTALGKKKWP